MPTFEFYETKYWENQGRIDGQEGKLSLAPTLEAAGVSEAAILAYRFEYCEWVTTEECKQSAEW